MHIKSRRKRGGWRAVRASWVAFRLAGGHRDGGGGGRAESVRNISWGNATLSVSCFFLLHDVRLYAGKIGAFCEELPARKALLMLNFHFRAEQLLRSRLVSKRFIVKIMHMYIMEAAITFAETLIGP